MSRETSNKINSNCSFTNVVLVDFSNSNVHDHVLFHSLRIALIKDEENAFYFVNAFQFICLFISFTLVSKLKIT